jgi:hypothetical protein
VAPDGGLTLLFGDYRAPDYPTWLRVDGLEKIKHRTRGGHRVRITAMLPSTGGGRILFRDCAARYDQLAATRWGW